VKKNGLAFFLRTGHHGNRMGIIPNLTDPGSIKGVIHILDAQFPGNFPFSLLIDICQIGKGQVHNAADMITLERFFQ